MTYPQDSNVSRETRVKLERYAEQLVLWNKRINLIDKKTEENLWQRHVVDSYQLAAQLPASAQTLIDYGSGAGLPGLILAAARPDMRVTCVERDQRKAAFLMEAQRGMGLANVAVYNDDVARVVGGFDVITARAFAPLDKLLSHAIHHVHTTSICLFPKGKNHAIEIGEAQKRWFFELESVPSSTDDQARILRLCNLRRA